MTEQTQVSDPLKNEGATDAHVEANLSTGSPSANATQADPRLAFINSTTKRNFTSIEEAEKYLDNLNRMVGDQAVADLREKAKITEGLVGRIAHENNWTEAQAREYLKSLQQVGNTANPAKSDSGVEDRLRQMELRAERAEFLQENPDAKPVIEKAESYAKATGKPLREAYTELYGEVLSKQRSQEQDEALKREKRGAQVMAASSTPPAPAVDEAAKLMDEYKKTGKPELLREAMKMRWDKKLAPKA